MKLVMFFKLEKGQKDNNDTYKYKYDSIAIAEENEHGLAIKSGEFSGKTDKEFSKISCSKNLLMHKADEVVSNNPLENTKQYGYYEIPGILFYALSKAGLQDNMLKLQTICNYGHMLELEWCGSENPNNFMPKSHNELANDIKISASDIKNMLPNYDPENLKIINDAIEEGKQYEEQEYDNSEIEKYFDDQSNQYDDFDVSKIDVNQIIEDLKAKIVGQDKAIEAIVTNIYANQIIIETQNKDLINNQKVSILLDGPTGTGKTAIIKAVADKLDIPMIITSATSYSGTGYFGSSVTDILDQLLVKTDYNISMAERGIVCLDEIDKLGEGGREEMSMKQEVQQELLAFISGEEFYVNICDEQFPFNTSNITFIGMGAFTKIRDQKHFEQKRDTQRVIPIGFNSKIEPSKSIKSYNIIPEDYIHFGLQREFVGRFNLLISTKAYSVEDYKNILLNSTISPLKMFTLFASAFGIDEVKYDDEFIQALAENAYDCNFGARGLQQIMSDLKNSLLLDIINSKDNSLTLTADMIKSKSNPKVKKLH
jgi:ATP-dependent Clp protease ATP-binding subunit ClpX